MGLTSRNVKRFRGGLACKAHRLVYHSTLGSRVIKRREGVGELAGRVKSRSHSRFSRLGSNIPQNGTKSPFSGPCFVLALAGTRRRVVQIKALGKDDLKHAVSPHSTIQNDIGRASRRAPTPGSAVCTKSSFSCLWPFCRK